MDIYSPKAQKPENFRNNTVKNNNSINVNKKATLKDSTINFEMNEKAEKPNLKKQKSHILTLDLIKMKFYDKLKTFFEYEERY